MHTTRNVKSAQDELPFRPLKWREFITATVKAAHPLRMQQAWICVRMEARQGRDSLLALFTTAVSRQGRRPGRYMFYFLQQINNGRDKQQNIG
ncbi:hypothetical protein DFR18_003790 [Salmonella bongori]|nr:hypothetical protein [Salmonella bongori]TNB50187.1 hypothetical protein FGW25_20375 [Salmonella bongori serovar 48:z35:-]ECI3520263.1 hypothetical protein [Salmonella bongori]EDP8577409.1 hypothetical protein [Salmonella bongori]EDP8593690.1 hypothetical protein [Salmonella bongori]